MAKTRTLKFTYCEFVFSDKSIIEGFFTEKEISGIIRRKGYKQRIVNFKKKAIMNINLKLY